MTPSDRTPTPVISRVGGALGGGGYPLSSPNRGEFDAFWTGHQAEAGHAAFAAGALAFVGLALETAAEFRSVGSEGFRGFEEPLAVFSNPQSGDWTTTFRP